MQNYKTVYYMHLMGFGSQLSACSKAIKICFWQYLLTENISMPKKRRDDVFQ